MDESVRTHDFWKAEPIGDANIPDTIIHFCALPDRSTKAKEGKARLHEWRCLCHAEGKRLSDVLAETLPQAVFEATMIAMMERSVSLYVGPLTNWEKKS